MEQIDTILFKVISEKAEEIEFGVKRGLLGYLLYVFDRLAELSDIRDFHISRELFTSLATLLVNRIHLMVGFNKASFAEPKGFHLFWDLPNYLYLLATAVKIGLLPNKINRMIKEITPIVLSTLPQNPGNSLNLYWSMRRLSVPDWENHTGILLNHLIEAPLSGFNLRNREAQAMQLPVLATLHNGIPEGVKDGISGYLVPERDIDQLTIKMKYLIDHPTIREEMGKQGRAFVMEKFDNNKLGKKLEEIYINLITMQ
nr:glycosyltransferase [Cytophagales bacterium]